MNSTDLSDIVKVTAAMLVKDNKIIIAKRGPDDKLADKWEFPGVDPAEFIALLKKILEKCNQNGYNSTQYEYDKQK